jgi:hypothetical protein
MNLMVKRTDVTIVILILLLSSLSPVARPSTQQVSQDDEKRLVYTRDLTIDDLPEGLEKRFTPSTQREELEKSLASQPTLVLDGATLNITPPKEGSHLSRSIAVKSIEFLHQGKIVTNGWSVEIYALSIRSDGGEIVSFAPNKAKLFPADVGSNGRSGLDGGAVILFSKLRDNDTLKVTLAGEAGQQGGGGSPGSPGAPGTKGEDASWGLFGCNHGGGGGGPGSQGGQGGNGGKGGNGGNGGNLILRGGLAQQRLQIIFSAPGGPAGLGGEGGIGGAGGQGGLGGNGGGPCGGGPRGSGGPSGAPGNHGDDGAEGRPGNISTQ